MNEDPTKREVGIYNVKTGEHRMSKPVAVQVGAPREPRTDPSLASSPNQPLAPTAAEQLLPLQVDNAKTKPTVSEPALPRLERDAAASVVATPGTASTEAEVKGKANKGTKPKSEIESLEQFIAYAYGRKGKRLKLYAKTERRIAENLRLDDAAMTKLSALAEADTHLAVPWQLLLVAHEVQGLPSLRAAINGFVSALMLRHPIFMDGGVQAALRNLPDAPPMDFALKKVAEFRPSPHGYKNGLKSTELLALREHALQLLATWLAISRGMSLEELSKILFQVVWAPAAHSLVDDTARLRALTDIEQVAGVGVACAKFRQNVIDAGNARDQAVHEAAGLRESVTALQTQLDQITLGYETVAAELATLKVANDIDLAEVRRLHDVERTHLRHAQEQLRGRLIRRLRDSIDMLEVGLTALRNKSPRTEVMVERAEHVIDGLRSEEIHLKGE